ncbi:MAG: hypothetical protein WDM76_11705 [Limisphaerales bacterium]
MIKRFLMVVLLATGLQASWGFALLGPTPALLQGYTGDPWQVLTIGYNLVYQGHVIPGGPVTLGDIGGPKNIGEEYRRNAPVLYYTYDANFLGYFGTYGAARVDESFAIMNNVFTNNPTGLTNGIDGYSGDLSEFPLQAQALNNTAVALYLTDIKSVTLHLLVEQMGLAQPERFTWTLHDRFVGTLCPLTTTYLVVQRNFDISPTSLSQLQYSTYVNNVLYSYYITEICTTPAPIPLATTVTFPVDPLVEQYTAVAANNFSEPSQFESPGGSVGGVGGLQIGGYYTGLTRDDVAGLRYLLTSNNINTEAIAAGSAPVAGGGITITNLDNQFTITTSNLTTFTLALTNGPAALQALYPGLVIAGVRTNFNGTFTYTFANLVTNTFFTNTIIQIEVQAVVTNPPPPGTPYPAPGTVTTNTTITTLTTNLPSGDFFIVPTNFCGLNIIQTLATNINFITNSLNPAGSLPATNIVTVSTNYVLLVAPCEFVNNGGSGTNLNTGLYQGIQKVQFVRANYDSLIGQFFQPVTNIYSMARVINSQLVRGNFQRVVTAPDILLSAADLAVGPAGNNFNGTVTRDINFDASNVSANLGGPGVINSSTTFTYNKVGPTFFNGPFPDTNGLLNVVNETTHTPFLQWASFDGSTNAPVVYPNGTSIQDLENQILVQISPISLSDGTVNVPYPPVTFAATGGSFSPPFTWSATGLPSGMTLSAGGMLSGTPTQSGTFSFILQLNDSLTPPRTVRWTFTIIIQ